MGYLELPQVEVSGGKLVRDLLKTKHVYILDCYNEVFVWFGRKSTRLVRAAAHKLSQELWSVVKRPEFAVVTKVAEGSETQVSFYIFYCVANCGVENYAVLFISIVSFRQKI